jgi:hypothetical protein
MTIEDQAPDRLGQDSGYRPELKRTLGPFQVFAISFAFISVAVGRLRHLRRRAAELRPSGHLALGPGLGGPDADRPGGGPVRGAYRNARDPRLVLNRPHHRQGNLMHKG